MKNKIRISVLILFIVVFLISISLTTHKAVGKAPYCDEAFEDCKDKCDDVFPSGGLTISCKTGCALGYLFC